MRTDEIPEVTDDDGTHVRIVCGNFWGKKGPVEGIAADPIYLDISVTSGENLKAYGGTKTRIPSQLSSRRD